MNLSLLFDEELSRDSTQYNHHQQYQCLWIHRPYLCRNEDEPLLFGCNKENLTAALPFIENHDPDDMIAAEYLNHRKSQDNEDSNTKKVSTVLYPFHVNYGTVTCCLAITNSSLMKSMSVQSAKDAQNGCDNEQLSESR